MISEDITLYLSDIDHVQINKREAYRYLGINNNHSNIDFDALYDECMNIFNSSVTYRAVISPISIVHKDDNILSFEFIETKSFHLSRNLEGMSEGFVFAATLGSGVDRLIMRYSRLEPSKAMVIDAIASAAIEGFCNKLNDEYTEGKLSRFRFSPGYGDLSLDIQPRILEYLDAQRRIGVVLSENLFMTPTKSVTAFFGTAELNK